MKNINQECWFSSASCQQHSPVCSWKWFLKSIQQFSWSSRLCKCQNIWRIVIENFLFFSFIGISGQLPATGYVKMVDVWMIFTLTYPFLIIACHCFKEISRDQRKVVMDSQGCIKYLSIHSTLRHSNLPRETSVQIVSDASYKLIWKQFPTKALQLIAFKAALKIILP